jgi:hypothetical protein
MRPTTPLHFLIAFVIATLFSACSSPEPRPARKAIVKDLVTSAAEDSLCPQVTPSLLRAIAKVESGNKANVARFEAHHLGAISGDWEALKRRFEDATSHGETQILGKTARAYGVEPEELRKDKETAYRLTALILATDICRNFKGDLTSGIAAYNAGPTWWKKPWKVKKAALLYAAKVMRQMKS